MGVVLLLMTIGGLFVAGILLVIAFWTKINWLKTFVFGGVTVWFFFYRDFVFRRLDFQRRKIARAE